MTLPRRRWIELALALAVVAVATVLVLRILRWDGVGSIRRLPDGSILEIHSLAYAQSYRHGYRSSPRWQLFLSRILPSPKTLARVLPASIIDRIEPQNTGYGLDFAGPPLGFVGKNLFAVLVNPGYPHHRSWQLCGLIATDDRGDYSDAYIGVQPIPIRHELVEQGMFYAWPRRRRNLGLVVMARRLDGSGTNIAEFEIPNPAYGSYPQWTPEPWPTSKTNGDLTVTLKDFESGGFLRISQPYQFQRQTRLRVEFEQNDRPVSSWMVRGVTIWDATGNVWHPGLWRAVGSGPGDVRLRIGLWPGENAYRIALECVPTSGFASTDLWQTPPLVLPGQGAVRNLTNHWERDGLTLKLVEIAAPHGDFTGQFQNYSTAWAGPHGLDHEVYAVALKILPGPAGEHWVGVKSIDDHGADLVLHDASLLLPQDVVCFKPRPGTRSVSLIFALQHSRFVTFLAKPRFVKASALVVRGLD